MKVPVIYDTKEKCCGCSGCYAVCPKNAIDMVADEDGFEYPIVDAVKCVGCHMCLKVCPFK